MKDNENKTGTVFSRAWEIISQDGSIPHEEKKAIFKLIQVLVEASERTQTKPPPDDDVKTITHEVISRHSLLTTVKHQADELDALKRISLNLTQSLDLQKVLDAVVTEAMGLVQNARSAHIFLYDRGILKFGSSLDNEGIRNKVFSNPRPDGLTYSVAHNGIQIIIDNILEHPLYKDAPQNWKGSIIGIPLKFKGEIVGVMNLSRTVLGRFSRPELRLMELLADHAAVAINNANMHKSVTELANTDSVTGLPNRRALDERLQEEWRYASRSDAQFSVVMMDLDGFKSVNDTFGHDVGDELLNSLFNFLAQKMRSSDFLARYGGDELTLVMHGTGLDAAQGVTQKVIDMMNEFHFRFPNNASLDLGITAGIAVFPTHANNPSDLLRAADSALYHAKKYHRGGYAVARGMTGRLNGTRLKGQS